MELFLKRSKGSITVLVTLILVPTIFFTGFLTDLSRLKLCGNQAAMAADNYGETVLLYSHTFQGACPPLHKSSNIFFSH